MRRMDEIEQRWKEIDQELADLADGRVVDGNPATCEGELLEEMDALEFEAAELMYPRFRKSE